MWQLSNVQENLYNITINHGLIIFQFHSAGTFGELEVSFRTEPLDLLSEVAFNGEDIMDFFSAPVPGSQTGSKTIVDVSRVSNPVLACAEACFLERACGSFEYQSIAGISICAWSVVNDVEDVSSTTGVVLYVKRTDRVSEIFEHLFYGLFYYKMATYWWLYILYRAIGHYVYVVGNILGLLPPNSLVSRNKE